MKAIVWTHYGSPDNFQLQEVALPIPKDNEILVKIHAATVTAGDCEIRRLEFSAWFALPLRLYIGLRKPTRITILGQEFAGEVVAVGKAVQLFKAGDAIFGTTGLGFGAYAEYKTLAPDQTEGGIALKPANMTYTEAAAVPTGGLEALHFLKKCQLQKGQKVLINGAGGSIGTFAVQLAKYFGAEVTGVDSAEKLAMLRSIGADKVIDYAHEDFTQNGEIYNVIFDIVGKSSFSRSLKSLTPNGVYLVANPSLLTMIRGVWISATTHKRVVTTSANQTLEDLVFLKDLIEAGKLKTIIDRSYPLEQTADAHRYVETGRKKGNVIITVMPEAV